jgi:hypothetical protein
LRDPKAGIFLLYPVLEKAAGNPPRSKNPQPVTSLADDIVTIGFALLFPNNNLPYRTVYMAEGRR